MMSGYAKMINEKQRQKKEIKIIIKELLAFPARVLSLKISKEEAVRRLSKTRLFRISRAMTA